MAHFPKPIKPLMEDVAREMSWQNVRVTDPDQTSKKPEPTFNRACRMVLEDALKVQAQRGEEYGDSWALENMNPIYLKAVLKEFDVYLDYPQLRLVMLAALVDVKNSRIANGNVKTDSVTDAINYMAVLIRLLNEYRGADK